MDSFAKRLEKARLHAKLSQAALARGVGLKPQAIQYLEDEKHNARGSRHTTAIAKKCRVDATWLSSGEGSMLPSKSHTLAQDRAEYEALSDGARQVAVAWSRLSHANQEFFRDLLFVHAAIDQHYPWLRRGRPLSETYDKFEQISTQKLAVLVKQTTERERR